MRVKISSLTVFAGVAAVLLSALIYVIVAAATGMSRAREAGQAVVDKIEAARSTTGRLPSALTDLGYEADGQACVCGEHRVFYNVDRGGNYLLRVVVDNASWVDYDSSTRQWRDVQ